MRLDASRGVLAALTLFALCGAGCDGVVHAPPAEVDPPAGEVWGRAVDLEGMPAFLRSSVWAGGESTAVREDGTFRFTGIAPPYDLVLGDFGTRGGTDSYRRSTVYLGVTRQDPVLLRADFNSCSYCGSFAYVTGRVPYAPRATTRVFLVTAAGFADESYPGSVASTYDVVARWKGSSTCRATLYVLRFDNDSNLHDGVVRSLWLHADERRILDLEHVPFASLPTVFLNGSFRTEPYTLDRGVEISVNFGQRVIRLASMRTDARYPDAFSKDVPFFPGATYQIRASADWYTEGGYNSHANARYTGVRPGDEPLRVTLRGGPVLVEPAYHSTEVDPATPLRWTSMGGTGIYHVELQGHQQSPAEIWNWYVDLYTASTEVRTNEIPALEGFLRPGASYYWSVTQLPAAASIDELLTARDVENDAGSESQRWDFSTGGAPGGAPGGGVSAGFPED